MILVGCGDAGPVDDEISRMSNEDIEREVNYCKLLENPSRMKHMSCENFKRECERRQKKNPRITC